MRLQRRLLNEKFDLLKQKLKQLEALSDAEREERILRAKHDFAFFARTYFPHLLEAPPSAFHRFFFERAQNIKAGDRILIAAPRGNAKTTLARVFLVWCIVSERIHFAILISDTIDQAKNSLEAIKIELEENPRLSKDFPDATGPGHTWQAEEIVTKNRIKIKIYGSGKRIRGANYRGYRPELIILDDLENDENVRTKEQRDKLQNWFERSILFLGPPDGSAAYLYIGTILHYDSLMMRLKKRSDFEFHKFKALISLPKRMDLWERWERIWREDKEAARKFYETRREKMDSGAEVLWPEVQPLYDLMCYRAASPTTFSAEMQNEPLDEEQAVFKNFSFYVSQRTKNLVCYGAVDPALGKRRGDFTAIIVVGREPKTGKIYVLEADIGRYDPVKTIDRIIRLQRKYRCVGWGIEAVAFQELFKTILIEKSLEAGTPVPAVGIKNRTAKEIRIESLAPHIENGVILFDSRQTTLLDQLRFYPLADHDDGPDALEMAFRLAYTAAPMEFRATRHGPSWHTRRGF
ncbi:phage terminase large subunit [Thermodesulforhabdus norvegica]|uniref:Phage uncharacterized protein (Putative large terminase), C-terminal domain-containing protein n=1 Tax=Thermodesulforhabdus norvegica TaxID=39841 RepID=A0A1I4SUI7_9BACT|nr:phage terminase large subunit [Thermodesulforhabdus norvegica]SFM68081.1 phage uncharacterized protein (putative large terminase), C-terminal domain-containing protein [Thermodesulforhabdus norvegica]